MPHYNSEIHMVPPRVLLIVLVLDASGSMIGEPISSLNDGLVSTINMLRQLDTAEYNIDIRIAVLKFNSRVEWLTSGSTRVADLSLAPIEAEGSTNMGNALDELNYALSRDGLITWQPPSYKPVVLFMTDGYSTDDWSAALSRIKKNRWFLHSKKIAVALGDYPDKEMLSLIVGDSEAVLSIQEADSIGGVVLDLSKYITETCCIPGYEEGSSIINKYKADKGTTIEHNNIDAMWDMESNSADLSNRDIDMFDRFI